MQKRSKDRDMNPAKINALLDTLKAACSRQFRFNPRRVAAGMRYVGMEGQGANMVHVFRDSHTHSQIELKSTMATLREHHGDGHEKKAHWTEAEKARYRQSDAEIDAEIAAKKAEVDFTRECPLYQDHRDQLLSHYKGWPTYQAGGPTARETARALVVALTDSHDPRLAAFAERMHTQDPEELTHLLLAPCHLEVEEFARSKAV
jgi:hypothetical protein